MGRCGEGDLRGGTAAVRVALPDALRAEHGRARASIFFYWWYNFDSGGGERARADKGLAGVARGGGAGLGSVKCVAENWCRIGATGGGWFLSRRW